MKIEALLYNADIGQLKLPPFARPFTWTTDQVIGLFNSLYRGLPVGSLVLFTPTFTPAQMAITGARNVIIDGTQRIGAIYSAMRGHPPGFLPGVPPAVCRLCFDIDREQFLVADPVMSPEVLRIGLASFFSVRGAQTGEAMTAIYSTLSSRMWDEKYPLRIHRLARIVDRYLAVEYMPDECSLEDCQEFRRAMDTDHLIDRIRP